MLKVEIHHFKPTKIFLVASLGALVQYLSARALSSSADDMKLGERLNNFPSKKCIQDAFSRLETKRPAILDSTEKTIKQFRYVLKSSCTRPAMETVCLRSSNAKGQHKQEAEDEATAGHDCKLINLLDRMNKHGAHPEGGRC